MNRNIKILSVLAVILLAIIVIMTVASNNEPAEALSYPKQVDNTLNIENEMALINQKRAENKLVPLSENTDLDVSACHKLDDMVKNHYWAHTSPSGVTPWHWFDVVGYNYRHAGENLAYGQTNASELIDAWMNSPEHKANILDKGFTEQGMCIKYANFQGNNHWIIVSHFGSKE